MSVECSPKQKSLLSSQYHFKIEHAVKISANLDEDEHNSQNESIESTFEDMNEFNDVTEQPINSD